MAAARPPKTVWHGSKKLELQAAVDQSEDASGVTTVLTWRGPWTEAVSKRPRRGQTVAGWPGFVVLVKTERESNEIGKVTATLRDDGVIDGTELPEKATEPKYEVRYVEIERPLETHPRYNKAGETNFQSALVEEDLTRLEDALIKKVRGVLGEGKLNITIGGLVQIIKSATAAERAVLMEFAGCIAGCELIAEFFKKWDAGVESYSVFAPVARKTAEYLKPGVLAAPGKIEIPAGFKSLPPGFKWLKTTADISWTGRFGRAEGVEEWRGAVEIDSDLYSS